MHRRRAFLGFVLLLVTCPGFMSSANSAGDEPGTKADRLAGTVAPSPPNLTEFLKARGYVDVPLLPDKEGNLDVEVTLNGQPLRFILDTGAGSSVIDTSVAQRLKLATHNTGKVLSSLTGRQPEMRADVVKLGLGPNVCDEAPIVSDLTAVNLERKKIGTRACDGILGNNVLQLAGAMIDLAGQKLFVLELEALLRLPAESAARATHASSLKDGRAQRVVLVQLKEAPVEVTAAAYNRLTPGMTYPQIGAILGGDLKQGRLVGGYTGKLTIVQGMGRIDLAFQNGRLSAKSSNGLPVGSGGGDRPVAPVASLSLADFLQTKGFTEVPLVVGKDGLLDVAVKVNGQALLFFLDTGTLAAILDQAVASRLKLPVTKTGQTLAGLSGPQPLLNTPAEFALGPIICREVATVTDFTAHHATRKRNGLPPWDGALGLGVMQLFDAVIDYGTAKLYLWGPAKILALPEGEGVKWRYNASMKGGRAVRAIEIELPQAVPSVLTKAVCERLQKGMTFAQIAALLGGALKNARMAPGYTGALALVQGNRRVEFTFQDSKMTAKAAHGLE